MEYPAKEKYNSWGMFGYESAMLNLAVDSDDPEGFMRFAKICGLGSQTLYGDSLIGYAAKHGARKCVEALYEAGENDPSHTKDEWLEMTKKTIYGPRSERPKN